MLSARRLPRVPLPAKLLLSYLLLLAVAAIPNFLYVRSRLGDELVADAEKDLLEAARLTAAAIAPLGAGDRVARAQDLARMTGMRVTLVGPGGDVLFDSASPGKTLGDHSDRPEVRAARREGSGVAERTSDTTGEHTLYAAARLSSSQSDPTVIRVARPLSAVRASTEHLTRFARNIQAAAISVALFLSFLAAIRFVRPLQKVTAAAKSLGAGDLAARSGIATDDEVGDAGRAIDAMAAEIRRRLANAGSGDAVLSQLVDALAVPCVVFEVTGEVLALNGAARTAFRVDGPNASKRLKEITATPEFERALEAAEGDGEPEPLDVDVTELPDNGANGAARQAAAAPARVRATVHVLKRPGTAPLYVLMGGEAPRLADTTLPPFEGVRPRPFADVLAEAEGSAGATLTTTGVDLEMKEPPEVLVVDIGHRVARALAAALAGCARSLAGRQDKLAVDVQVEPTRVKLAFEADPGRAVVDEIRPLLEPLGGGVSVERDRETTMWIPRA